VTLFNAEVVSFCLQVFASVRHLLIKMETTVLPALQTAPLAVAAPLA
jgi:hypothetical protein